MAQSKRTTLVSEGVIVVDIVTGMGWFGNEDRGDAVVFNHPIYLQNHAGSWFQTKNMAMRSVGVRTRDSVLDVNLTTVNRGKGLARLVWAVGLVGKGPSLEVFLKFKRRVPIMACGRATPLYKCLYQSDNGGLSAYLLETS